VITRGNGRQLLRVIGEEHVLRICVSRSQQKHPASALRNAEGLSIDYPVRPGIAERFQLIDDVSDRFPILKVQHEGYVLKQDPTGTSSLWPEQSKYVLY